MIASYNGHHDVVRNLLEYKFDINAKSEVRNQMMMMTLIIVITTMVMLMIVINVEV